MFSIWYAIGFYPLCLFAIIFAIWLFTKKSIIFCKNYNAYNDNCLLWFLKYVHEPYLLRELISEKPMEFIIGFIGAVIALLVSIIILGVIVCLLALLGPIILIPIFIIIKTLLQIKKGNKN